jgi:hypothetical protein
MAFLFRLNLEREGAVPVPCLHEALRRDREIFHISFGSGGSVSQTLSLTSTQGRQEGMLTTVLRIRDVYPGSGFFFPTCLIPIPDLTSTKKMGNEISCLTFCVALI